MVKQGSRRITDCLPDQQLGISEPAPFRYRFLVRQKFVYGSYLAIDEMEERVYPAKGGQRPEQKEIDAVSLSHMVLFMPEYLFSLRAVAVETIVPEDQVQE